MYSFRGKDLRDLDHGRFGIPVPKDGKRQRELGRVLVEMPEWADAKGVQSVQSV